MYVTLRVGDHLPAVASVQWMLNQTRRVPPVVVDAIFGAQTGASVAEFQRQEGLPDTGIVDTATWNPLANATSRVTVDSIDGAELDDWLSEAYYLGSGGGVLLGNFGMSMGVPVVLQRIATSASPGSVAVLRFSGHGSPGHMTLTLGRARARYVDSMLAGEVMPRQVVAMLGSLRPIFGPCGSIELHGCSTGRGPKGRLLLRKMADACGVPVTAALITQYGGHMADRFEGPTATVCPGGASMPSWFSRWNEC